MLWEQRSDAHHVLASGTMRLDRFEAIYPPLHVANNANLDPLD